MFKYRIPPGVLGTGKFVLPAQSLCHRENPVEEAIRSALPLHRRQLLQLGEGKYNSWRNVTAAVQRCAGTYVSKSGGFESWLRTGYDMSDDEIKTLVPKANQRQDQTLYQRTKALGGSRGARNVLQPKLTGDRMVLKSPLNATVRRAGLTLKGHQQGSSDQSDAGGCAASCI
jgi:hypothetical protein